MKWYLKKPRHKFQTAFREDYYKRFEDMILNIQELSQDVRRAANLSSMAETRQIGLIADRTLEEVRTGHYDAMLSNDRVLREQAETKYEIEQLRLDMQENAAMMKQLVLGRAQRIEEFENRLFLEIKIGNNTRQQLLWEVERNAEDTKSRILGKLASKDFEPCLEVCLPNSQNKYDSHRAMLRLFPEIQLLGIPIKEMLLYWIQITC